MTAFAGVFQSRRLRLQWLNLVVGVTLSTAAFAQTGGETEPSTPDVEQAGKPVEVQGSAQQQPLVTAALYTARFDGQQLVDGVGELQVASSRPSFRAIPLAPFSLTVTNDSQAGAAADGRWWAETDANGQVRFDWRLAPQRVGEGRWAFDFALPECPRTRLTLSLPDPWRPEVAETVIEGGESEADGDGRMYRTWRLELGARSRFVLHLTNGQAGSNPPSYQSRSEVRMTAGRVDIATRLEIDGDISGDRLLIRADSRLTILDAIVDGVTCEIAVDSRDSRLSRYAILLPLERDPLRVVRITAIGAAPRSTTWTPPRIEPVGLEWTNETLTVIADPALTISPANLTNAAHLRTQSTSDDGLEMTFRFFRAAARVRLRVSNREPELLYDVISSVQFSPDQIQARCDIELRSLWGSQFVLEFPKPSTWIIDTVETIPADMLEGGGGAWEVIRDSGGDRLVVNLSQPVTPQRSVRLVIDGTRPVIRGADGLLKTSLTGSQLRLVRFPRISHLRHRIGLSAAAPFRLRLLDDVHLEEVSGGIAETDRERLLTESADILVRDGPGWDSTHVTTELAPAEVEAEFHVRVDIDDVECIETYYGRINPATRPIQSLTVDLSSVRAAAVEWFVDGVPIKAQRLFDDSQSERDVERWALDVRQQELQPFVVVGRRVTEYREGELEVALAYVRQAQSSGRVSVYSTEPVEFDFQDLVRVPVVPTSPTSRDHRGEFEYQAIPLPHLAIQREDGGAGADGAGNSLAWGLRNRLISEYSPDGRALHTADLWVQTNGRREVKMSLPSTAVALQMRVDGENVPLVIRSQGQVVCPLPSRYAVSHIHLVYRTFTGQMRFRSAYEREFVETDFPSPSPHWYVAIPRDWGIWNEQDPSSRLMLTRLLGPVVDPTIQRRRAAERLFLQTLRRRGAADSTWRSLLTDLDRRVRDAWGGQVQVDRFGVAEIGLRSSDQVPLYQGGSLAEWLRDLSLAVAVDREGSLIVSSRLGMATRRGNDAALRTDTGQTVEVARPSDLSDVTVANWVDADLTETTLPHPVISRQRVVYDMETLKTVDRLVVYQQVQIRHVGWGIWLVVMGFTGWLFGRRSGITLVAVCMAVAAAGLMLPIELGPLGAACFVGVLFGSVIARLRRTVVVTPIHVAARIIVPLGLLLVGSEAMAQMEAANQPENAAPMDQQETSTSEPPGEDAVVGKYGKSPNSLPRWHIRSATYRWNNDLQPPRLIVDLDIRRVREAGVIALDFQREEVTPLRVSQGGEAIGFDWSRSGAMLLNLSGPGASGVRLEMLVKSSDDRVYSLSIPQVARSQFRDVSQTPAVMMDRGIRHADGWYDVGPRQRLRILPLPESTGYDIDLTTHVNMRTESVTLEQRYVIRPRGMIRTLRFSLPEQLRLVNPAMPSATIVELEENDWFENGTQTPTHEIRLESLASDEFEIVLTLHLKNRSGIGRVSLPDLNWVGGDVRSRIVSLTYPDDVTVDVGSEQWVPVDEDQIDAVWVPPDTAPQDFYRAVDPQSEFSIFTQLTPPTVDVQDQFLASVGARNVAVRYTATVVPQNRPVSIHQIHLPRGLTVRQLTIVEDNVEYLARFHQDAAGMLTVYLPEPTIQAHQLDLEGQLPLSRMTSDHSLRRIRCLTASHVDSQVRIFRRADAEDIKIEAPESWEAILVEQGGVGSNSQVKDAADDTEASDRGAGDGAEEAVTANVAEPPQPASVGTSQERSELPVLPATWSAEFGRLTHAFRVVDEQPSRFERPMTLTIDERTRRREATVVMRVDRELNVWTTTCDLYVEAPPQTQTDVIQLQIPEQWQAPFEVTPPARLDVRENDKGRRLLVLVPEHPLSGSFRFSITGQVADAEPAFKVTGISPLNMDVAQRYVDLPIQVDEQQVGWQLVHLEPRATMELPDSAVAASLGRQLYLATRANFEATLGRLRSQGGFRLVRLADVYVSLDAGEEYSGTVIYDVEPAGELEQLSLGIPSGLKVDHVRIGNSLTAPQVKNRRVLLKLHSRDLPQRIEVRFHGTWDPADYRLSVPRVIGTDVARTLWTVTGRRLQDLRHGYPDAVVTPDAHTVERFMAIHSSLEMSRDRLFDVQVSHAQDWYAGWLRRLALEYRKLTDHQGDDTPELRAQLSAIIEEQSELATLVGAAEVWALEFQDERLVDSSRGAFASSRAAPESSWRLAFSGSRFDLNLNPSSRSVDSARLRWFVAALLVVGAFLLLLFQGVLDAQLVGTLPNWSAVLFAVFGLFWGAALHPPALAVALVAAAILLARPRRWPGVLRRFRRPA